MTFWRAFTVGTALIPLAVLGYGLFSLDLNAMRSGGISSLLGLLFGFPLYLTLYAALLSVAGNIISLSVPPLILLREATSRGDAEELRLAMEALELQSLSPDEKMAETRRVIAAWKESERSALRARASEWNNRGLQLRTMASILGVVIAVLAAVVATQSGSV